MAWSRSFIIAFVLAALIVVGVAGAAGKGWWYAGQPEGFVAMASPWTDRTSTDWGDRTGVNGNISADPMFVNFAGGNYHLKAGSPAINTGTASGAPSKDIDGDNRPQGAGYDLGFDEWTASPPTAVGLASFIAAQGGMQPWILLALGCLLAGAFGATRLRRRSGKKDPLAVLTILGAAAAMAATALWPVASQAALADGCGLSYSSATIAANTSWVTGGGTVCISGQVVVADGVTLTVGPGVVVKFQDAGSYLHVYGALSARGTGGNKVYFTSIRDDTVGGDTNQDGGATSPDNGNWWGLYLDGSGNHGLGDLDWTEIRYGGAGGHAGLFASSSQAFTLTNSLVSRSSTDGARFENGGAVTVTNSLFTGSGGWGLAIVSNPVRLHSSDVVSNSAGGLYLSNSGASVIRNTLVISNTGGGVGLLGDPPTFEYNNVFGNGANYVALTAPPIVPPLASVNVPTITLTLSDFAVAAGAGVTLTWQIGGPAGAYDLVISAREPGSVYTSTVSPQQPGMPPANGSLYYLKPDRTWTASDTVYVSPSVSGSVPVILPSSLEGEWQFEAQLRRPSSSEVSAFDASSLLASSQPAMLLHLNRPIANTGDRIRAELLTSAWRVSSGEYEASITIQAAAPVQSNQTVKIAAWLQTPGGALLSLPGLDSEMSYAYEGVINNGKIALLDRDLADLGPGEYQIQARTFYSDSGWLMRRAVASFSICDTPGTVTGTGRNAAGQPLGGGSPRLAAVSAFDVDDGETTASTTIDASGSYSLTLLPGRYLLSAKVLDGAGLHSARDQEILKIGCSGVAATRNLTASSPVAMSVAPLGAQRSPALRHSSVGIASGSGGAIPQPSALADFEATGISGDLPSTAVDVFVAALWRADQRVNVNTREEIMALLANVSRLQGLGGDDNIDLSEIAGAINKRFTIVLKMENVASVKKMTVLVVDLVHGTSLYNQSQAVTGAGDTSWVDAAEAMANALGPSLYRILDGARDRPIEPRLYTSASPSSVQAGGSEYITVTLKDADGTPAPQGKGIDIIHDSPAGRQTVTGVTDGSGVYHGQLPVGGTPGRGRIEIGFTGRDHQTAVPQVENYRVSGPNDLNLSSPKVQLRPAETADVCASLSSNGTPRAGAVVTMTADSGSMSQQTVTTGPDGQACATYTAGSYSRIAEVTAQSSSPVSGTPSAFADIDFVVDGNVYFNLSVGRTSLQDGGITSVRAYVTAGSASVPGLPVAFSLAGNGSLSANTASTDYNGNASVTYVAPASGSGTTVINAVATVETTTYTKSVTIQYQPATCQVSLPAAPRCYNVERLSGFYPIRIAEDGRVFGTKYYPDGSTRVVSWQSGGQITEWQTLNTLGGNTYISEVADVNDSGVAVGTIYKPGFGYYGNQAVRWENGTPTRLEYNSKAFAINNNGDAVGFYYQGDQWYNYARLWPGSRLPNAGGYVTATQIANAQSFAYDINDSGKVAFTRNYTTSIWYDDQVTPVGLLPSASGSSSPTQINNSGYVVGWSNTASGANHGFLWDGSAMTDLGILPGYDESLALGVNSSQQVVGWSDANEHFPFLWERRDGTGKMYDLSQMVDYAAKPLTSDGVWRMGINDSGWILISSGSRAVVLKPRN